MFFNPPAGWVRTRSNASGVTVSPGARPLKLGEYLRSMNELFGERPAQTGEPGHNYDRPDEIRDGWFVGSPEL